MSQLTLDLMETTTADLTTSERHRILEADHRRYALSVLDDRTGPIPLDAVANEVATSDPDLDETDATAVQSLAMSLHHIHLPKLDEAGLLEYDTAANQILP